MTFDAAPKDWTFESGSLPGRRRSEIGLWWFVVSLGFFFASGLLIVACVLPFLPRPDDFEVPRLLYVSTAIAVAAGWLAGRAVTLVRRERQTAFRRSLVGAMALGGVFCVVQGWALGEVLAEHLPKFAERRAAVANQLAQIEGETQAGNLTPAEALAWRQEVFADSPLPFSGGLVSLVGLHVLHFAGGLAFAGWVTWRAFRGEFDHEYFTPVRFNAIYWRFMDGVWLATFGLLLCL
ncbi:MAG: hypothetical protein AAF532_08865 [Planctomycetota bacterium]